MGRAEDTQYTIVLGTIAQFPAEDQADINSTAATIRGLLRGQDGKLSSNTSAVLAFSLVAAELAKELA